MVFIFYGGAMDGSSSALSEPPALPERGRRSFCPCLLLPLIGRRFFTLEALCYGAAMGIRLLGVITAFALYNTLVHPDKVTGLLSRLPGNRRW